MLLNRKERHMFDIRKIQENVKCFLKRRLVVKPM